MGYEVDRRSLAERKSSDISGTGGSQQTRLFRLSRRNKKAYGFDHHYEEARPKSVE